MFPVKSYQSWLNKLIKLNYKSKTYVIFAKDKYNKKCQNIKFLIVNIYFVKNVQKVTFNTKLRCFSKYVAQIKIVKNF
jgi:hypothetical protein